MKRLSGIRKLGIVGGTFNPIHMGHLRSAEEAADAFELERVVFIVSAVPPHKQPTGIVDADHRWEMVKRAVRGNPRFAASNIEIKRPGASYTIDTLRHFRRSLGPSADIFFIMGLDAFLEIATWREYQGLFTLSHFIVTDRPTPNGENPSIIFPPQIADSFTRHSEGYWEHTGGMGLYYFNITALDISATRIRGLVKEGKSIRYLVPESVQRYIEWNGLFR